MASNAPNLPSASDEPVDKMCQHINNDLLLPPLPRIENTAISQGSSTHSSFKVTTSEPVQTYEQYAHLGQVTLDFVLAYLLDDELKTLAPGAAMLVSKKILAALSSRYSLPARLFAESSCFFVLRSQQSVEASLFQAYVGGLVAQYRSAHQNSLGEATDMVRIWILEIFRPLITLMHPDAGANHGLESFLAGYDPEPLSEGEIREGAPENELTDGQIEMLAKGSTAALNEFCCRHLKGLPEYEQAVATGGKSGWQVTCRVESAGGTLFVGVGARPSVKNAKAVAAWKVRRDMGILDQGIKVGKKRKLF